MANTSERRINSAQVKELCGGISDMTLWRWAKERNFPTPIYIGPRKYWKEAEVLEWFDNMSKEAPARHPNQAMPRRQLAEADKPAWMK